MKHLYFFIFCLMTISVNAQIISTCQADSILLEKYERTVKGLALEQIYQSHHIDTQSLEIPQVWQEPIMEAIAAVYNIETAERDSVFSIYCITDAHFENSRRGVYAHLDTSISWVYDWFYNDSTIADPTFNAFALRHNLQLNKFLIIPVILFYKDEMVNFNRLADTFAMFPFFTFIEQTEQLLGDGNHVTYWTVGNNRYLDFELAWGDCPAGCIFHRTWRFEVLPDCSVNFLQVFGQQVYQPPFSEIPNEVNCLPVNTKSQKYSSLANVNLYPNPTTDYFKLKIETKNIENFQLEMYDILGEKYLFKTVSNSEIIDIAHLPNGFYFLILKNKNNEQVWKGKILKK